jgi:hypothetical protein
MDYLYAKDNYILVTQKLSTLYFQEMFAFHIMLHIIIKNNCQRNNNEIPTMQTSLHFWDKLLNVFLIPNKEKCE